MGRESGRREVETVRREVERVGLLYQPARMGINSGFLKRFTNSGSGGLVQ